MRHVAGGGLIAGVLAAAALTGGVGIARSVPPTTEPPESTPPADVATQESIVPPRTDVALPGLLDESDDELPDDPSVRTGTLANGLRYYVRHNEQPGRKVELRLAVNAGSVNETGPNTGVAHFVEHMLFNGTARYPENELIDVLSRYGAEFGADINAYTSFDETVYMLSVPHDDDSVDTGLDVLHEWLTAATFDPAQVEAERGVVTDEWRRSTQTVGGRLFAVAEGMYLSGTAYGQRSPIGTAESIGNVGVEELRDFYDDWYRPDNAAIVVVGDIAVDTVVADLETRFADAAARTDTPPARPETTFPIESDPAFALHSDPDQATVDVEVTLPLPAFEGSGTADLRVSFLDAMIFEALLLRLDGDATAGRAPFDDIGPGTNSFVERLDAPALYAYTDAERVDATLLALLDEYERASRFGFTSAEAGAAQLSMQAELDAVLESADSTPDEAYADLLVGDFLSDTGYASIADWYDAASAVVAGITPEALDLRFRARWDNSAPHVIISSPTADEAAMPTEADVLGAVASLPGRAIEPRPDAAAAPERLMTPPEPVKPVSDGDATTGDVGVFETYELVFANGARVLITPSDIVTGEVAFGAVSAGGTALIDDADLVDALYAADIVTSSGVGGIDQSRLEAYLAGHSAAVGAWLTPYTENLAGGSTTSDLETLFQLVHLYITAPRVDPIALTQVERATQPLVDNPSTSPEAAGADALNAARYGGDPHYDVVPTPEEFATLDIAGVERVWRDRFGDAGDWVFTFAGDVDVDVVRELAARYIGTLPAARPAEHPADLGTPPPSGVVREVVNAGTGNRAALTVLFTSPIAALEPSTQATLDVVDNVVNARLIDVIREELGESYSPQVAISVVSDPNLVVETYVDVTGAPDRIEVVADLVVAELADLAANGPTDAEFAEAHAQVAEGYQFATNGTLVDTMIEAALAPDGDVVDFLDAFVALDHVTAVEVQAFIADHLPTDRYIQVAVKPVA